MNIGDHPDVTSFNIRMIMPELIKVVRNGQSPILLLRDEKIQQFSQYTFSRRYLLIISEIMRSRAYLSLIVDGILEDGDLWKELSLRAIYL